jgi:hypothetical protein
MLTSEGKLLGVLPARDEGCGTSQPKIGATQAQVIQRHIEKRLACLVPIE